MVDRAPTLQHTFDAKHDDAGGAGAGGAAAAGAGVLDPDAIKKVKAMIAEERAELEKVMVHNACSRMSKRAVQAAYDNWTGGGALAGAPAAASSSSAMVSPRWKGLKQSLGKAGAGGGGGGGGGGGMGAGARVAADERRGSSCSSERKVQFARQASNGGAGPRKAVSFTLGRADSRAFLFSFTALGVFVVI